MTAIAAALRDEGCAKTVARLAGVHPRTAARWQAGDTWPPGPALLRLMAARPSLAARLLDAAGLRREALRAEIAALRRDIEAIEDRLHAVDARAADAAPRARPRHGRGPADG